MKLLAESGFHTKGIPSAFPRRLVAALLGLGVLAGGSYVVQANDGPDIYGTIRQFAAPRRAEPRPVVLPAPAPLPRVFHSSRETRPTRALGFAPVPSVSSPFQRSLGESESRHFPRGEGSLDAPRARPKAARKEVRREARKKLSSAQFGTATVGMAHATNYCVRLCDGYAFPIGFAGGSYGVQEAACRQACPGAEVQLYTAPAGAKDFDALSRGGASYTALPTAFKFRDTYDKTCRCTTPGTTASASAFLLDPTLRAGDLVMTRAGAQHFDGGARLPYRIRNFSDALAKLTNKQELARVRDMEAASVRGILSPKAPDYIRNRVAYRLRQAETEARRDAAAPRPSKNYGRGFQELRAREAKAPAVLRTVQGRPGIVALN